MSKSKWGKADWSSLKGTFKRAWGTYVSEEDVDEAVANIFTNVVMSTDVTMEELVKKNRKFFNQKCELFEHTSFYTLTHPRLVMVEELLRVPVAA